MKKTKVISVVAIIIVLLLGIMLFVYKTTNGNNALECGYRSITSKQAENYVGFLSDDLLQGRDAGTHGGQVAALYIISLLKEWNIKPFIGTDYCQPFDAVHILTSYRNGWEINPDTVAKFVEQGTGDVRRMNNVLAVVPGKLNDEFVIIGAHYDHLGMSHDNVKDRCYNGADDNASGVSAVLQIAKAISLSGEPPMRTIIFAFWDGEEKGLLGSKYFVSNWQEHSQIKAYMNFDMVGRGPVDNPCYMKYFFTKSYPAFEDWLREDMEQYDLNLVPDYYAMEKPVGGSDNDSFARVGVPVVWYHTDGHPDFHRPSDSSDKINYKKLLDVTRAAYLCAWRMANETQY